MRKARPIILVALLAALTQIAFSQYAPQHWQQSGVRIRQGYHIEWQRAAETDENGNVAYTWSDTRLDNRDVYAQLINSAGQKLWGNEGVNVVSFAGRQEDPLVMPNGNGDYIFIWNDFRNDYVKGDLYAQKLNSSGQKMWNPDGVLLSTGDFDSPAVLRMVADGTGGAIVVWDDVRDGDIGNIYATRITSDGTIPLAWPEGGLPVRVAPASQTQLTVDSDGNGGAYVGWMDDHIMETGRNICAQRITINAGLAWSDTGIVVCDTTGDQEAPKLCPDGQGGIYMVWEDKRIDYNADLYIQHMNSAGQKLFPEAQGRMLIDGPARQSEPRIVNDESGNAIVMWLDTRNDVQNLFNDIYAQKITSNGTFLWTTGGAPVCTEPSDQTQARFDTDGTGGIVVSWMDERNGNETPNNNIFAQRINSNGTPVWTTNGKPVCEMNGYQFFPLVRAFPSYTLIAWGDERTGSPGIYYQKVNNTDGNPVLSPNGVTLVWGISGNADHVKMLASGQNKFFIFYQDLREGPKGYQAYVQMIDENGLTYLAQDGVKICPDPTFNLQKGQELIDVCTDGNNGALAVWQDHRDSNIYGSQIYAQRVTSSGTLAWNSAGIRVAPYDSEEKEPRIISDGANGGIIVWSEVDASSPYYVIRVRAAKITQNGAISWTTVVYNTETMDDNLEDICSDGSGGVYIVISTGDLPDYNLYAQHLDASGNATWGTDGIAVCTAPDKQVNCRAIGVGSSGVICVWEDNRSLAGIDLYAQRINPNGTIGWATNGIVINNQPQDQASPDLSLDGQSHLFTVWQDYRNGDQNLYMQKVDYDGNLLYPATGMLVCDAPLYQVNPRIATDGTDGCFISWEDFRGEVFSDIWGTHLDSDGALSTETIPGWGYQWVENGNIINDAFQKQNNCVIIPDNQEGIISIWEDKRSSGKEEVTNLYTQRLNAHVAGIEPVPGNSGIPHEFNLYPPYPNPFNPDTKFRFDLIAPVNIRLSVYDAMGRQVAILKDGRQEAGSWEVTWNASNLASGQYFVRLQVDGKQLLEKVLLVK
jgi:hypothetical protein